MSLDISADNGAGGRREGPDKGKVSEKSGRKRSARRRKPNRSKKRSDPEVQNSGRTDRQEASVKRGNQSQNHSNKTSNRQDGSRNRGRKQVDDSDPSAQRRSAIFSAIDLGTNNCRLLIAKQSRNGFRVIDAFSRIVRLGEGIGKDNRLSEEAMDRTIAALKVCAEKLARRNVNCMRHVATEACRIANNSEEFVARVKRETGINLDVISAGEEARLAVLGCQSLIAPEMKNVLVFDIGGGSTELIWVKCQKNRANEIHGWMSVPWGVVNLTEKFAGTPAEKYSNDSAADAGQRYKEMVATISERLQTFEDAHTLSSVFGGPDTQFLGTSGTVTTLASLHLGLPHYIRDKVDGAWMKSKDISALSRKVAEMTPQERAAEPCIGEERADLVVAGCAILEAILDMWPVPSLRVADRGIREGILRGLMQIDEPPRHVTSPVKHQSETGASPSSSVSAQKGQAV